MSFPTGVLLAMALVTLVQSFTVRTMHRSRCLLPRQRKVAVVAVQKDSADKELSIDWDGGGKLQGAENEKSPRNSGMEDDLGNIQIPSTGISVSDEIEASQKDRFVTEVVPVKDLPGVAQLVTSATVMGSFEPVRYLVSLSPPKAQNVGDDEQTFKEECLTFAMVDVPPFSRQLVTRMKAYMGVNSKLKVILVTSRNAIHYDEAVTIYSTRRADVDLWAQTFSGVEIVSYRLDTPRDCRAAVTQCLDGYGPFALDEKRHPGNVTFVESGRPLTRLEWDHDVAQEVLSGQTPPDDEMEVDDEYSLDSIRIKEEGSRILAIFTPGHSFGSVSYVFPETKVCCSGFTLPVEDTRAEENWGIGGAGPALDCRGYITTNRAGINRQVESARSLISQYIDRFEVVLPSRGDPLFLEDNLDDRKNSLLSIVDQYDKIGQIYEQLGITGSDAEDG